jgi:hypothetical protein
MTNRIDPGADEIKDTDAFGPTMVLWDFGGTKPVRVSVPSLTECFKNTTVRVTKTKSGKWLWSATNGMIKCSHPFDTLCEALDNLFESQYNGDIVMNTVAWLAIAGDE